MARAAIALANTRDGGWVLIGVNDDGEATGWEPDALNTWKYDDVAVWLSQYSDPSVRFSLEILDYAGRQVVVLHVEEFEDIPVLCAADRDDVLRRGACYVRSRAKPESVEVGSQEDMRDLIQLATEKQLRRTLETVQGAGLRLGPDDAERYREQIAAFGTGPTAATVNKTRSRGHFEVVIHPTAYTADRIDYDRLFDLVRQSVVSLRGWDMPHIDDKSELVRGADHIEQATDWERHVEAWRFHQSGLFVHVHAIHMEWEDQVSFLPQRHLVGRKLLGGIDAVWMIAEIFELAARLAQHPEMDAPSYTVSVAVHGLKGRELYDPEGRWGAGAAHIERFERTIPLPHDVLIGSARRTAAEVARDLLLRFGVAGLTVENVVAVQDELFRRGNR